MPTARKKLIEVAMPLDAINTASAREKSIRHGHPSTLHLWWARRPLAACRAVLFGQLVDDPSSWPDLYPTEADQDRERQRLFEVIENMGTWENSNDEKVIDSARLEIARSVARNRMADDDGDIRDGDVLVDGVKPEVVNAYLAEVAPPVHDPFAGGGSIPLEAQRLGLRAIATDLNPVAVLINKALIEIPPKFAGTPPVNPDSHRKTGMRNWKGAQGLAEDVRYYGKWMRDEAFKRIGHLYPPVKVTEELAKGRPDLVPYAGQKLTVIAWLWARTVASPNPAVGGVHVPLVSSFWLFKKKGKETWAEPVVDVATRTWRFDVRTGQPEDAKAVAAGTKMGRGDFRCLLSGDPIPATYIRAQGKLGRLGDRLMAIVADGGRVRLCLPPTDDQERIARVTSPAEAPDTDLPEQALGFRIQNYGMRKHRDLFTNRQLTALDTYCDLALSASKQLTGGAGKQASDYAEALTTYLALGVSKMADYNSKLVQWSPSRNQVKTTFTRQALPMVWDFGEVNPFAGAAGDYSVTAAGQARTIERMTLSLEPGRVFLSDATRLQSQTQAIFSTDPPYYDNVPYADLSDFFYLWQRHVLQHVYPDIFRTMLVPKAPELVADPFRHGGKREAEVFFETGMTEALRCMVETAPDGIPTTIYYAFKQTESDGETTTSTGWETFLAALADAGFSVVGTWPVRTERGGRMRDIGSNALATSVVLVCRKRPDDAPATTRSDFRRLLRQELPKAVKALQKGNIAPVDMAQASIGPGMAIFSRHSKVVEADGSSMTVRTALQMINEALDEYLAEQTGEFGPDTRFAVTWFETRGFEAGPFGDAETLAKARNVSVEGIKQAGILDSVAGKVRLLKRDELPDDWEPESDPRITIWECTQHLIKRLEDGGEQAAADLLARLGSRAEPAHDLAYRLYQTCIRKGWAEEARAYNGLGAAWPELARLAAQRKVTGPVQERLL